MNECKLSKIKCLSISRSRTANREAVDSSAMLVMDTKVHIENGTSPRNSCDVRISGHSTPVQIKCPKKEAEDSPEIDYCCSPIMIPLTQDGGNEIAWDWQCPTSKHIENVQEMKMENVGTPKRNKLVKKRNSNSPLLYKPLKRKLVKSENMESIGKFAAELQALTEQMRDIKRTDEVSAKCIGKEICDNSGTSNVLLAELDVKKEEIKQKIDLEIQKNASVNNVMNKLNSLEELFDDSINDSMIRCSQEIEEKYIFGSNKENAGQESQILHEKVTKSPTFSTKSTVILINCSDISMKSRDSGNSPIFNVNNCSKTYSKMSSTDLSDDSESSKAKNDCLEQCFFNNNILNIPNADHQDKKTDLITDDDKLFEIPDDSFDDCLATCAVEESSSSSSKSVQYDNIFNDRNPSASGSRNDNKSSNPTRSNFVPKTPSFPNRSKVNGHVSANTKIVRNVANSYDKYSARSKNNESANNANLSNGVVAENRKFFKTKSLSDSCYGQGRKSITNSKVNAMVNSSNNKSYEATVSSSVNTNVKNIYGHNVMSTNGVGNTHVLNVNRFDGRKDGEHIVRYNSLNNLNEGARECTPEEIEKKRLEARKKLEAKRKLQVGTRGIGKT